MTFGYEEYESLCAAMALVDAASGHVGDIDDDIHSELVEIQNMLNDKRLAILKSFGERVWHVSQIAPVQP